MTLREPDYIVSLSVQKRTNPARKIPVDELIADIKLCAGDVPWDAQPCGPGTVAFIEGLVDAGDAHLSDFGDGGRPHGLNDHFTRGHQVDRLIKLFPESPELPLFLGLDQERNGLVNLLPRHVAFVVVLERSYRLTHHRCIHDTDGRDVQNRRLAPKLWVEEFAPLRDGTPNQIGTDPQRVRVIDRRYQGHPLGGLSGKRVGQFALQIADFDWGCALTRHRLAIGHGALRKNGHHALIVGDALDVQAAHIPCRDDLRQHPVLTVQQIKRGRLRRRTLDHVI